MVYPELESSPQVPLVQRDQEVKAIAPDAAHEPFTVGIRLGRSVWVFKILRPISFSAKSSLGE